MTTSRTERHWNRQLRMFEDWIESVDLKHLSDVKPYVSMHGWDNACDCVVTSMFRVARSTVLSYLDDEELSKEIFNSYR